MRPAETAMRQRGFTLVELIMVIVLVGILSVVVLPRLNMGVFERQGFFEEALAATRYAHRIATTSGCDTQVAFTSSAVTITQRSGCKGGGGFSVAVANPTAAGSSGYSVAAPSSVTSISVTTFYYDSLGRPFNAGGLLGSNLAIAISGGGATQSLIIEQQTGFAHAL